MTGLEPSPPPSQERGKLFRRVHACCVLGCLLLLADVAALLLLPTAREGNMTWHLLGVAWQLASLHLVVLRATVLKLKAQVKRLGMVSAIRNIT